MLSMTLQMTLNLNTVYNYLTVTVDMLQTIQLREKYIYFVKQIRLHTMETVFFLHAMHYFQYLFVCF